MIPIELIDRLRSWFFSRDRDITMQSGRTITLGDGRIVDEHVVPSGGVIFWPSTAGAIPSGWTTFSAAAGRFLVGAGGSFSGGATGGATTIDIQHGHGVGTLAISGGSHTHSAGTLSATGGSHNHNVTSVSVGGPSGTVSVTSGSDFDAADGTHNHTLTGNTNNEVHTHTLGGSTGSDSHSHTVVGSTSTNLSSAQSILPPYLVGTWIQKQ